MDDATHPAPGSTRSVVLRPTPLDRLGQARVALVAIVACAPTGCGEPERRTAADTDAEAILEPPAEATDPRNPAVFIEGGVLARSPRGGGATSPRFGPRTTRNEGLGGGAVGSFWMQRHEVTNEEYAGFDPGHLYPSGEARHPVVNVTWEEAMAYAISIGGRLPDEAEWEFAARGPEGRTYPWGDEEPTCARARFLGCGERGTVEVMMHPAGATRDGVHDLAGNVWEWVMPTWFEPGRTPVNDESRRSRGGSFDDDAFFLRSLNRNNDFPAGYRYISTGFRVVWPARP